MSDPVLVALIMAVPPTMAVLWSRREAKKDAKIVDRKIDHVVELTNSGATEARDEIKALRAEVAALREHIGSALPKGKTSQDVVPQPVKK